MDPTTGSRRARMARDGLRRQIADGSWSVGTQIPTENELMDFLDVGRTTVREAVRSLASLGMLETLPGRGTFVRSRTPVSPVLREYLADYAAEDLLALRHALEVEAARRAATSRTSAHLAALSEALDHPRDPDLPTQDWGNTPGQFHFLVFEATGSPLLTDAYAGLMPALRRAIAGRGVAFATSAEIRRAEHGELLAAIEAGDPEGAAAVMTRHASTDLQAASTIAG